MVNKCKVEMREGELYNVVESLIEGDGKNCIKNERNRIIQENSILVFLSSATILSMSQTE